MNKVKRKFSLKRFIIIPIVSAIFFLFCHTKVFAENDIPEPTDEFYVNDFAGIFTDSQIIEMVERAEELASIGDFGYQVVLTTVKSLNGEVIEDYSIRMAEYYAIGKDGHGVQILFDSESGDIRIELGIGMEDMFTDSDAGHFLDVYAIPDFKEDRYAEGLMKVQKAIIEEIKENISVPKETPKVAPIKQETVVPGNNNTSTGLDKEFWAAASFLIALIACVIVFSYINKLFEKRAKRKDEIQELNEKLDDITGKYKDINSRYKKLEANYNLSEGRFSDLSKKYDNLIEKSLEDQSTIRILQNSLTNLKEQYDGLHERHRRAKALHPDLDKEIEDMILKEIEDKRRAIAKAFDDKAAAFINKKPGTGLIFNLNVLLSDYKELTSDQKKYVTTDIEKIEKLLRESEDIAYHEEADDFMKRYNPVISNKSHGTEEILEDVYNLRRLFDQQIPEVKNLIGYERKRCCRGLY